MCGARTVLAKVGDNADDRGDQRFLTKENCRVSRAEVDEVAGDGEITKITIPMKKTHRQSNSQRPREQLRYKVGDEVWLGVRIKRRQ